MRLYFSSRRLQPQSLPSLRLGKWRPRRQTGALHLVNPEEFWHKTNGFGSVPPPRSTWLTSHGVAAMRRRGICSLTVSPGPARARSNSSLTTKQHRDTEAEVDKFINDNNEDDDNINN